MKTFCFLLLMFAQSALLGQEKITTVILFRHAEKGNDGSTDPGLTEAGSKRAVLLADLLGQTKIDAIYSTHFKRTESTVQPLADKHGLKVLNYDGSKPEEVNDMISKWKGGTIVICGHSNTTPAIANHLVGKDEYKAFADNDYRNLLIVTLIEVGSAKVTWLRY